MSPFIERARMILILMITCLLLMPVSVALANAVPSLELWLAFEYETSEPVNLEGVQLIGWDPDHNQPLLIQEYGRCGAQSCLDSSSALVTRQALECLEDRCVAVIFNYGRDVIPPFKVVGQFSDRARESDPLSGEALPGYGTVEWQIEVQDTALAVSVSEHGFHGLPHPYSSSFLASFVLTLVTELLVAALLLRLWLRLRGRNLLRCLGYVLLANLISYPVTWFFWPMLGRFQPVEMRQTGYVVVLVAGIFAPLLVVLSRKEGKARRRWLTLTMILLPVAILAFLLWLLYASLLPVYGGGELIAVQGLPASLTIVLAELFAVAFEALFLYLLARKALLLSLLQAAVISVVMNASSFLAGLALSTWL